jgi:hypothetical protein
MGIAMKFLMMAGILLFVGIGSAGAQAYVGGPGSGTNVGAGSSLNSTSGINGAGAINTANSASNSNVGSDSQPAQNVQATNSGEFVPSTFENYRAAVSMGEEAGHVRPPTVVEAARLAQQVKAANAAKPAIVLEKDAEGKLIIVETEPAGTKQIQTKR